MYIEEKAYRICDKCGIKVPISKFEVSAFHFERPLLKGKIIKRDKENTKEGQPYPTLVFDLCTKCADEMMEWITTSKKQTGKHIKTRKKYETYR